jgi:hypothetical protein
MRAHFSFEAVRSESVPVQTSDADAVADMDQVIPATETPAEPTHCNGIAYL